MKKTIILLAGLVAAMFTACTEHDEPEVQSSARGTAVISASIDQKTSSRTIIGDDSGTATDVPVYWSEGDAFSITINETPYTFAIQEVGEKQTTADFRCENAPTTLPAGTYTAEYPATGSPDSYTQQKGTKDDLREYHYMTATFSVGEGATWNDVELNFSTNVAIVRLTLTNDDFKNQQVNCVSLMEGDEVVATTTEAETQFTADANGTITVYFSVPAQTQFTDAALTAKCGTTFYRADMSDDKTLGDNKLYRITKTMAVDYTMFGDLRKYVPSNGDVYYTDKNSNLVTLDPNTGLWAYVGTNTDYYDPATGKALTENSGTYTYTDGGGDFLKISSVSSSQKKYTVYHAGALLAWNYYASENLKTSLTLGADIDLSGVPTTNINNHENNWIPIGNYSNRYNGEIDGQNKSISGLRISGSQPCMGLLCSAGLSCKIINLSLIDAVVYNTMQMTGGIIGYSNYAKITNCSFTGTVTGGIESCGGIVGKNEYGEVANSIFTGNVEGPSKVGGIIGMNSGDCSITSCINNGKILGQSYVGGIVGIVNNGAVVACFNNGESVKGEQFVGGIIGYNCGNVSACGSAGSVTYSGTDNSNGGIIGKNTTGGSTITACWTSEDVAIGIIEYSPIITAVYYSITKDGEEVRGYDNNSPTTLTDAITAMNDNLQDWEWTWTSGSWPSLVAKTTTP